MGRELQKKKRRSGKQPVRRPPTSKKKILNNPIIRENWNKTETLSQNYRRLGLVSKLNKRAGGTQKLAKDAEKKAAPNPFAIHASSARATQAVEEVLLQRDPATGASAIASTARANPLNDALNELDDDDDDDDYAGADEEEAAATASGSWVTPLGHVGSVRQGVARTRVTDTLEEVARGGVRARPRHQSTREEEWVERLVERHGEDYGAMFRDRELNVMQQSEGVIKRRVRKWLAKSRHV